jgi:hypothetical protein
VEAVIKKDNVIKNDNKSLSEQIPTKETIEKRKCDSDESLPPSPEGPKSGGEDPRVKNLMNYFRSICEEEPTVDRPKDIAAIKRTLEKNTEERIKNVFQWYIESPKAKEYGLKVAVALSNHSLSEYEKKGKWLYEEK